MSSGGAFSGRLLAVAAVICLACSAAAQACSACFGDPDSPLTKGALAGVIVLGVVVYGVLFGFVGIVITWHRRAKRLDLGTDHEPPESDR